jgi:hypothetical protein
MAARSYRFARSPWLLLAVLARFFPDGIVVNIFDVAPNTLILMMRLAALFLGVVLLALTIVRSTSSRASQSLRQGGVLSHHL